MNLKEETDDPADRTEDGIWSKSTWTRRDLEGVQLDDVGGRLDRMRAWDQMDAQNQWTAGPMGGREGPNGDDVGPNGSDGERDDYDFKPGATGRCATPA